MQTFVSKLSRHSSGTMRKPPQFGLIFDIDGVLARGKTLLPGVSQAFDRFIVREGQFSVPTVFLTNASNSVTKYKVQQLSQWLNVEISPEQVILAHRPLQCVKHFHSKNAFVTGQGPLPEIAQEIGFEKILTVEELRRFFPQLDHVDHARREFKANSSNQNFQKVEIVVLIGEPVRWETALQLILDLLMSDGDPSCFPRTVNYPHIPVLACNFDLLYSAEAPIPRIGHGAFLLCLESLYKKLTGFDLTYTHLVGKPSTTTHEYAYHKIREQAQRIDVSSNIVRLYTIGDNVNTDIFGANLFNDYIRRELHVDNAPHSLPVPSSCSVLVKTGVYSEDVQNTERNHMHRNFHHLGEKYYKPNYIVQDVTEALELIFQVEGVNC